MTKETATPKRKRDEEPVQKVDSKENVDDGDGMSDEDDELLAAAEQWASGSHVTNNQEQSDPSKDSKKSNKTKKKDKKDKKRHKNKTKSEKDSKKDTDKGSDVATSRPTPSTTPNAAANANLSLHLTQVSFDATDFDVRSFFTTKGCLLTSVRLVYDRSANQKTFRGVAFVDVADSESYKKALKLNRHVFMGRKLNVRPTKSHAELADIVSRTKEIVAAKIEAVRKVQDETKKEEKKKEKEDKRKDRGGKKKDKSTKKTKGVKRDNPKDTTEGKNHAGTGRDPMNEPPTDTNDDQRSGPSSAKKQRLETNGTKNQGNNTQSTKQQGKPAQKLSKKERNRKAAIIMARRRGRA